MTRRGGMLRRVDIPDAGVCPNLGCGWPNLNHPGTRDAFIEVGKPLIDGVPPKGMSCGDPRYHEIQAAVTERIL